MPITETPDDLKEPGQPEAASGQPETAPPPTPDSAARVPQGTSRWIDYDSHELLEMISELEDERRWHASAREFSGPCSFTSC